MYHLYVITNSNSKTIYVGVSKNPDNRLRSHRYSAKSGVKTKLYDAMRSYGFSCFTLEVIHSYSCREECYEAERQTVLGLKRNNVELYNLAEGGSGGFVITDPVQKEQWKAKLRKARVGRKPALGMKHTEETKEKAAQASNKYWASQETYDPEVFKDLSFKQASALFGISKTHFYRLRKRELLSE